MDKSLEIVLSGGYVHTKCAGQIPSQSLTTQPAYLFCPWKTLRGSPEAPPTLISWWPEPEPCLIWPLWGWIGACLQAGRMQVQSMWTVRQQGLQTYVLILALRWPISAQRSLHSAVPGLPAGWHFLSTLCLLHDESTDTVANVRVSGITGSSFFHSNGDFFLTYRKEAWVPWSAGLGWAPWLRTVPL